MNFSPNINASGKPLGLLCSSYLIFIPRFLPSGNIFLYCLSSPLFTIIKISLILASIKIDNG